MNVKKNIGIATTPYTYCNRIINMIREESI